LRVEESWHVVHPHVSEVEVPVRFACLVAHSQVLTVLGPPVVRHQDLVASVNELEGQGSAHEVAAEPSLRILPLPMHHEHTLVESWLDLIHLNAILAGADMEKSQFPAVVRRDYVRCPCIAIKLALSGAEMRGPLRVVLPEPLSVGCIGPVCYDQLRTEE